MDEEFEPYLNRAYGGGFRFASGFLLAITVVLVMAQTITQIAYPTQVKQGPIMSDASTSPTSTLTSSCSTAVAAGMSLSITKTWTASATCAATLVFNGGRLTPAAGKSITISPRFTCGEYQQCFDVTAAGSSVAFSGPPGRLSPTMWGADASGSVDSTAALRATLAASLQGGKLGNVHTPCGTFKLSSTVTWPQGQGGDFSGDGAACTNFTWAGNNSTPIFLWGSLFHPHLHDFAVTITSAHPALEFAEISTVTSPISSRGLVESILINAYDGAAELTNGFVFDGVNANNDFWKFINVTVQGTTGPAWYIRGSNSVGHQLIGCVGQEVGYAVETTRATDGSGGSAGGAFQIIGGGFGSAIASVFINNNFSLYPIAVRDADFEDLGRFMVASGFIAGRVLISNVTWQKTGDSTDATTDFIQFTGSNLTIENLDAQNFSTMNTGVITLTYHNSGGNSEPGMTINDSLITTTAQTVAAFMGSSDSNPLNYLHWRDFVWQDPGGLTHGYYGSMKWHSPLSALLTGTAFVSGNVIGNISTDGSGNGSHSFSSPTPFITAAPYCFLSNIGGTNTATPTVATTTSAVSISHGGAFQTYAYFCPGFN